MSLGGVDLSEVETGYLMDTSPVREVVYTGPEYMLKKAGEQANLTF